MGVLPILEFPDIVLRKRAKKVRKIDASVLRIAENMVETLNHVQGIGLAANQVGVLQRIIVIRLPNEDDTRVYINPEIVHREGEREVLEGCLSVPGYQAVITRAIWVKARALDKSSKLIRLKADAILAQALEHEIDHLNGILYIDHLKSHQKLEKIESESEELAADVAVA